MNKILSTLFAAVAVFHSTLWYDEVRVNGTQLDVSGRVEAGTISADVARVQTKTLNDSRVLDTAAYDSNMDALEKHCQLTRRYQGRDASRCYGQKTTPRVYPTISQ